MFCAWQFSIRKNESCALLSLANNAIELRSNGVLFLFYESRMKEWISFGCFFPGNCGVVSREDTKRPDGMIPCATVPLQCQQSSCENGRKYQHGKLVKGINGVCADATHCWCKIGCSLWWRHLFVDLGWEETQMDTLNKFIPSIHIVSSATTNQFECIMNHTTNKEIMF